MTRRVVLHVGAPKTGTTYLQDRLMLNRTSLARHGVRYPMVAGQGDHFPPALDLLQRPWGGMERDVEGSWAALMARVERYQGTVVVSHEILAAAKPAQVRRALGDLADSEVHLVYSARDLGRQIPAEWQEGVKHQRRLGFAGFVKQVRTSRRANPTLWFWRVQSLPDVLQRWTRDLPPERVHVVTVPQPGAPRDLLFARYARAFGIDPGWAPEQSERDNVSIGAAETYLLRKLNRRLRQAGLASEDYRRLVRELVVHQTLAKRPAMTKVTLPPTAQQWAAEVAEEWIEAVRASGFDVVGDLDDLRPAPPSDQRWVDPDRPRRAEMLEASMDVIVALALEAADAQGRPGPVTTTLTRAARRLRPSVGPW